MIGLSEQRRINIMADRLFMYAIVAGVFAAFTAVFAARAKRYMEASSQSVNKKDRHPIR